MASLRERGPLFQKTVESLAGQVDELHVAFDHPMGDAGKFATPRPKRAFVLTVDDDIIYPPGYAQTLITALENYERRVVVGVHGVVLLPKIQSYYKSRSVYHCKSALGTNARCHILGTGTLAYYTGVYPGPELTDFSVKNMADIWFAIHAKSAGVKCYAIARPANWIIPQDVSNLWNIYDDAHNDDAVQTRVLNENNPWPPITFRMPNENHQVSL
jgi:hypothetical protein